MLRLQQRFKSYYHAMYIEEVNEIALNSKDDKRSQTFDRITSFPPEKVLLYAKQILNVCKAKVTLLSKECENELYVACNILLQYIERKCLSEMKKYVKFEVKK